MRIVAVINTLYTNTFDTLYYESINRKDIDFIFCVIPFCRIDGNAKLVVGMEELCNMLEKKSYPYIKGYDDKTKKFFDLKILAPDAVFVQTPYDNQRISNLYSAKYISSYTNLYTISYGASIISYDVPPYNKLITNNTSFMYYKYVFSESEIFSSELNKYNGKYLPIGYIKCDKFLNYRDNDFFKFQPKDKKFSIAWKPRWVAIPGQSNFFTYIDYFLKLTENHPDILLYFINHSLLKQEILKNKLRSSEWCNDVFNKLLKLPNVKILGDDDFLDYVFNADIFVGDYCSTIVEYGLTGKPIIYNPTNVTLSEFGQQFIEGAYQIDNIDDLDFTIKNIKNGKDSLEKQKIREKNRKLISYTPPNGMSIAQYLLYILNRENLIFIG